MAGRKPGLKELSFCVDVTSCYVSMQLGEFATIVQMMIFENNGGEPRFFSMLADPLVKFRSESTCWMGRVNQEMEQVYSELRSLDRSIERLISTITCRPSQQ